MTAPSPLVDDVRARRPGAWARFVQHYERLVLAVPRALGLSDAQVEEVYQSTFSVLFVHLQETPAPSSIPDWVVDVARRESELVTPPVRDELAADSALALSPPEVIARWERIERIRGAVQRLPERCQRLLTALDLADQVRTYREAADALGIPLGSVGPTRQRCLEQLSRLLANEL